ncbi:lysozyme family protein [Peribacillus butanolivorans]|uniref:lysozyme family protein n=1 Tax=Peribacillus butanolivorans TaxID=421767 RepID=UPI0030C9A639
MPDRSKMGLQYISLISISPEVERYRDKVEVECIRNGFPETVDLILSIIMQESGWRFSKDVMQSSESKVFPPNSIKDPYQSIEAGIK